jgi:hypothetical protein
MAQVTVAEDEGEIARPLNVLIPLIKKDFEAAEEAGLEYYTAAGEKLNEARDGHFEGDSSGFYSWAEKNFGKKRTQIKNYMAVAAASLTKPQKKFKNLEDFYRRERGRKRPTSGRIYRGWTEPVDAEVARARAEQARLAEEEYLNKRQEEAADTKLAMRLIAIGYKVLAQELHPDKGGSREAMSRLNRVRDRLKEHF